MRAAPIGAAAVLHPIPEEAGGEAVEIEGLSAERVGVFRAVIAGEVDHALDDAAALEAVARGELRCGVGGAEHGERPAVPVNVDFEVRACVAVEFSLAQLLNQRGNADTSGARRRADGENVFDQGSRNRAPVAISVPVNLGTVPGIGAQRSRGSVRAELSARRDRPAVDRP